MKKAFTMLELTFVIVIIGILSSIAIPKLAATRDDAVVSKARNTVAALRSTLATERQKNILKGDFARIDGAKLEELIEYDLDSDWSRNGDKFIFFNTSVGRCEFSIPSNKNKLKIGTCDVTGMKDL